MKTGRKPLKSIDVGDWVLGESLLVSRVVGGAWKVTKRSGSRLYLTSYRMTSEGALEVRDERIMQAKSVRMAFHDYASAEAVSLFARQEGDEYERLMRDAASAMKARVYAFADNTPELSGHNDKEG